MKTPLSWSGSSQVIKAGVITTSQRQSGTPCSGSMRRHFPLNSAKPWRQQARCCSPSFSTSKVHYLLNSFSTEEPLTLMCTVRHSEAYAGPSRTKDWGCSLRVWFCSMIMHIHTSPGSHMRNWPSSSGSSLTIRPTARTCRPEISMLFGPLKKHLKGKLFNFDDELKEAVKDWVSSWS